MKLDHITALDLQKRLSLNENLFLLDVREPQEFAYARIEGSMLIPLRELPQRLAEIDRQRPVVVICHHGMRSLQAAHFLTQAGFENVANLTGGIEAWSRDCDASVPRY